MNEVHRHATRGASERLLKLPTVKSGTEKWGKKTFAFQGAQLWNSHVEARMANSAPGCRIATYLSKLDEVNEKAEDALTGQYTG